MEIRSNGMALCVAMALATLVPAHSQAPPPQAGEGISFSSFRDASLLDVVDILARRLGINYVVDPAVRDGTVTVNTYGQMGESDLYPLLETILRMNGAAAVRVGNLLRIVPLDEIPALPVALSAEGADLPDDERFVLNAIRLRHVSATDLADILAPFLGPGGRYSAIESANTLLLLDNGRNMRRAMDLVSMFDVPELEDRLFRVLEVENSLVTALAEEIREVFRTLSLSERRHDVRFLPLPRIGALLVVSASAESIAEAERWVDELDRASVAGGRRNFVYRAQYGEAVNLATTISRLYAPALSDVSGIAPSAAFAAPGGTAGSGPSESGRLPDQGIRIVPDPINNLVLAQATQQEWEAIRATLLDLDAPPRQVLIDARIYEVSLSGSLSSGVSAYLRSRSANGSSGRLTGGFDVSGLTNLSLGMLVGSTRELALFLEGSATDGRTRVISAPTLVATDNIPAEIVVGQTVPTLSSQAVAGGAFAEGSSLFTNTISNVQTGVRLSVTARVNASGIVTMQILQEVSTPSGITGPIQSPTIDRRNVSTQVTVNDGDTVAIGGIIQETRTYDASRVPVLGRIPVLGRVFGGTTQTTAKTELIVLLRPQVIYDQNQVASATEELRERMRSLRRLARDDRWRDRSEAVGEDDVAEQ